jgi:hypothetical protein
MLANPTALTAIDAFAPDLGGRSQRGREMVTGSYVAAWRRGQAALQQPSGLRMCSVREPTWYVVNVTSAVILPQREHS